MYSCKLIQTPDHRSKVYGPGDVVEGFQIFTVPVEVRRVEKIGRKIDDVSECENFSGLLQDGALRHLDIAAALQVVAQELDGVNEFVQTRKRAVAVSLNAQNQSLIFSRVFLK